MNVKQPAIVVGISGSEASAAALRWAADEARRRHATLRVVRSWGAEFTAPYAPAGGRLTPGEQRAAAGAGLASQLRTAFGCVCPAGVAAELADGAAERTLVDRSAGADLLVLGSASPPGSSGRSIGRPVGPVVRACLGRAQCPVVVVCAGQQASQPRPTDERRGQRSEAAGGHELPRPPRDDRDRGTDSGHYDPRLSGLGRPALVPVPQQAN